MQLAPFNIFQQLFHRCAACGFWWGLLGKTQVFTGFAQAAEE